MSDYLLRTYGLTKQYRRQKAVDHVSMNIEKGAIYGFIGRNGAGKTTFLKMISGLAAPTDGEIELFGCRGREARRFFDRIGLLIEAPGLYPDMNAFDNLKLKAICTGMYKKNWIFKVNYISEILDIVGLGMAGYKKVKNFSLGMKQRLGIAMALIGEPDLLILDEPINGLDPQGIAEVRDTVLRINQERNITVILSSHILEELTKLATHYGIIDQGRLLEEMPKEELLQKCSERIEIQLKEPDRACPVLERLDIHNYRVVDPQTIYIYERFQEMGDINTELVTNGVKVGSISIRRDNLEQYFMKQTGGASKCLM